MRFSRSGRKRSNRTDGSNLQGASPDVDPVMSREAMSPDLPALRLVCLKTCLPPDLHPAAPPLPICLATHPRRRLLVYATHPCPILSFSPRMSRILKT